LPHLQTEIWEVYEPLGLKAVAISSSTIGPEDPNTLGDYIDGMGLTMPVLLDVDVSVYQDYFIVDPDAFAPYPREFIIDGNGMVLYTDASIDVEAISAVLDSVL
jgi:peroxiredoxin